MECLICYKLSHSSPADRFTNYNAVGSVACQLLQLPGSFVRYFSSTPSSIICDFCLQRLADVDELMLEVSALQRRINELKGDIERDLINSQKLSVENGREIDSRARIAREITSRSMSNPASTTIPGPSNPVNVKAEIMEVEEEVEDVQVPDFLNETQENPEEFVLPTMSLVTDEAPVTPKNVICKDLKNAQVNLERIQLPVGVIHFSVAEEPARSYLQPQGTLPEVRVTRKRKKIGPGSDFVVPQAPKPRKKVTKKITKDRKSSQVPQVSSEGPPMPSASSEAPPEATLTSKSKARPKRIPKICDECGKSFDKRSRLEEHKKRKHSPLVELSHHCTICPKSFISLPSLTTHLKTHGIGKVLKCPHCYMFLKSKTAFETHLKRHESKGSDPERGGRINNIKNLGHNCHLCPRSFKFEHTLNAHVQLKHHGVKLICPEPDCHKEFSTTINLKNHQKQVHEKAHSHFCPDPDCGKGFIGLSEMVRHHRRVHLKERDFLCEHCSKTFAKPGELRVHVAVRHQNLRSYLCQLCGKNFASKFTLKKHVRVMHDPTKPPRPPKLSAKEAAKKRRRAKKAAVQASQHCQQEEEVQQVQIIGQIVEIIATSS